MTSIAIAEETGHLKGGLTHWPFEARWCWALPIGLCLVGGSLVAYSLFQRFTTGLTYEHWSRYIVMSFCFASAIILSVTRVIDYVLTLLGIRLEYLRMRRSETFFRPSEGGSRATGAR
jgi:hypothetical protein